MNENLEIKQRLETGIQILGINTTVEQTLKLLNLIQLLTQWGQVYNLTAIKDPKAMIGYHILDSLTLLPYLQEDLILDLGTGAGFPGLPLAIMQPNRSFTLLDSNGKKIRFIRQVILELGIVNVETIQSRIELYCPKHEFTTIVARALAPLPQLINWAKPLLQKSGILLASKGPKVNAELAAVKSNIAGLEAIQVHQVQIPYIIGKRYLVEIQF